jgi:AmmeMemoRadiSam system protein B
MEVWLLFAPERVIAQGVDRIREVTIGTHGLQIFRGQQRGLLLPGVATDHGWDAEQFLDNVCIKAGLPPTAWKEPDTTLLRFEGNCIQGSLLEDDAHRYGTRLIYASEQIEELRRICRDNIAALIRGATPLYYISTVPDATVTGVSLIVTLPGSGQEIPNARMSIRDPMPLQSTLFSMCEEMAAALRRRGFLNANFSLDLSIAYDPAMHGSVGQPDVSGIDPQCRAVLVSERGKTAWIHDRDQAPEILIKEAAELCQVADEQFTQVFSLAFQCTRPRVAHAAVPRGVRGPNERPPAVAGRFYPADVEELNRQLDQLLSEPAEPQPCLAVMVPHAGWMYSGKLAARVLQQVRIPRRVIIIGPKHTPHGTDWAVAPHQVWQLPGRNVASDYELAMKLAARVPGLEPDAVAHQAEHGIEVELPILARLAPETQVVGVALSAASLERCEQFAEGLAAVIRELDEPPLLVISSDMNHYATDAETRRLDALALEQLDRLDEDGLYRTCRENHISMCGVIPAVIVLKTLKKLGGVHAAKPVGYSTSADVTGDVSRVVGYAGRIFV